MAPTLGIDIAKRALYPQAAGPHGRKVPSARHEMHLRSSLLQPCPEIPSDATRSNDCDTHE